DAKCSDAARDDDRCQWPTGQTQRCNRSPWAARSRCAHTTVVSSWPTTRTAQRAVRIPPILRSSIWLASRRRLCVSRNRNSVPTLSAQAPRGFGNVETWVFDLDNTLYPHHLNLWQQVDERIRAYVSNFPEGFERRGGPPAEGLLQALRHDHARND